MNRNLNPLGLRTFAPYDASTHNFAQLRGTRRRAQVADASTRPLRRVPTGLTVLDLLDFDEEAEDEGDDGW